MYLQFFEYDDLFEAGRLWMLMNPNKNDQNAARVLKVWTPVVQSIRQAHKDRVHPLLSALYCSFLKAQELTPMPDIDASQSTRALWQTMAADPSAVVDIIAVQAELAGV